MASLIAVNELPPYVLYLYGEKDYKELKRLVDRYNTENRTTKIQITKPNLVGKGTTPKSKTELLSEYKAKLIARK
jgi:hypothetical protein